MKLRIMTFNIRGCKNYLTNKKDINSIVKIIRKYNPDIIGLNEVFSGIISNNSQSKKIARKLGYYSYFGKSTRVLFRKYGNSIISKYPILNNEVIIIPDPINKKGSSLYETRSILKSTIEIDNKKLNIYITHLGLNIDEQENGFKILNSIDSNNSIIMGDFNIEPDDILLNELNDKFISSDNYLNDLRCSFPSKNPINKLDYIFVSKDIKINYSNIMDDIASDHLPYVVDIEI